MPPIEWDGLAHDYFMECFVGQQRVASNVSESTDPVITIKFHSGFVNQLIQIRRDPMLPKEQCIDRVDQFPKVIFFAVNIEKSDLVSNEAFQCSLQISFRIVSRKFM